MHDFLIALAFVAMVTCPAIVGFMQQDDLDEEPETDSGSAKPCAALHLTGN